MRFANAISYVTLINIKILNSIIHNNIDYIFFTIITYLSHLSLIISQ